ncbi:glycosyltransferase family 4 protein [Thiomicrospira microaerophila]|uniref:glycosyltransferase family 4 protein n=1 Tax=Thiomicrospira microaerophila TaxID=406020 RepID=UPI000697E4D4|nr:glycosyltransferase family 4 protein [Thiomicrospira microaerophila]
MKVLTITDRQDRAETELYILLSKKIEKFVVLANPTGRYYVMLKDAGVDVRPIQIKSRFDKKSTQYLAEMLADESYDIVHAYRSHSIACMLRAGKSSSAKLLAYRGVTTGVGYLVPESWITLLHPRLDGIMCVAEAIRQSLIDIRFLWLRFPVHKPKTIHKGHNPDWYEGEAVSVTQFGVPAGAKTLCCISRNSLKKGVLTLVEAFKNLDPALNAHLLLIGNIDQNMQLKKQVKQPGLVGRVHFTGYRNDATQIIRGCDVLVSASESGEGLPRVAIEAMCVGTPVVATDSGGTREVVLDGQTGLLIKKGDVEGLKEAVTRCLTSPALQNKLSTEGLAFVKSHLTPEKTAKEVYSWYQALLTN